MFRQFLISTTLVAHAVAALLGHAGLHALMGHEHGEHTAHQSLDLRHSQHSDHCTHDGHNHHESLGHVAHRQANHDDGQPESPAPSHDDDDCLVCQFAAQQQAPLTFFSMPVSVDFCESTATETMQFAPARIESAYDSRGPPAV